MRRRELLGTVTGLLGVSPQEAATPPRKGVELLGDSQRIWVDHDKSKALVLSSLHPQLGLNPPLTADEVHELAAARLTGFSIAIRVAADDLDTIFEQTKPQHVLLGHVYDDTCVVLARHRSLRSIEIMGGGISSFGLKQLLQLNLESLSLGSTLLSQSRIAEVMRQRWNTPAHVVDIRTHRYRSELAWRGEDHRPDGNDSDR